MIHPADGSGVSLLYHDVVPSDESNHSGLVSEGSWRYKLPPSTFREHLEAIASSSYNVTTLPEVSEEKPLLLTFDDGGSSCAKRAAPTLEEFDFRGHFFVVTGRLGESGYVTHEQVRQLHNAGHHIGSHTVSHANLRELDPRERVRELRKSKAHLEDLLGTECTSISIPGGFSDRDVVGAAFDSGYDHVFVSEPRYYRPKNRQQPIGRWNIWHDTSASDIEDILGRSLTTRMTIQGRWYTLKLAKRVLGQERFERLRRPFVSRD